MTNKKTNNMLIGIIAIASVAGGIAILMFPTLLPGTLKIVGWIVVGGLAVTAGILKHIENKKLKLEAEKALEKQRLKRSKKLKEETERREQKLEELREKMAQKEEKQAEKWVQIKKDLVKEAGTVWAGRVEEAAEQEDLARKIIKETKHMEVKNAAGQLALLWHETSSVAQWTAKQIVMFSQRPSVTTKAREEAQEAIIEAAEIKEKGGNWSRENGERLAKLKEKARDEAKIEEKRLEAIKDTIENAEMKWRASESQIRRWQAELNKVYTEKK